MNLNKPIIFEEGHYTKGDLEKFKSENRIWEIIDLLEQQLQEFFEITNPHLTLLPEYTEQRQAFVDAYLDEQESLKGDWVYFPWSGQLIHILPEKYYKLLLTNRNRNLINSEEQNIISQFRIGILGLSIGNSLALTLAHGGFSKFKMADFDTLSTSNLNRVRASLYAVATKKTDVTARQIYELNPFADLILYPEGLQMPNINEYLETTAPGLILEVVDDFVLKIQIRKAARQLGIPVIMPTSLGDTILIDVERYDLEPNLPLFNGLIGNTPEDILSKPITESDKQRYAVSIVGKENVPLRALQSVLEVHKTLTGRPQLMSTVTTASGIIGFLARAIALNYKLASGRYKVKLDELFNITL